MPEPAYPTSWSIRLARVVLGFALFLILGWPVLATIRASLTANSPLNGPRPPLLSSPSSNGLTADIPRPFRLALETIRVVVATQIGSLLIGIPLALVLFRTNVLGRRLALGLLILSAFIPLPIHATAWLGAFGNAGRARLFGMRPWLIGWPGVALIHTVAAVPWVVMVVGIGLRSVEQELEEIALLDLPAWKVALRVTLRRSLGAIAAAALAVAVLTAGEMTVTDLLQVRTYAEEAYNQSQLGNGPAAMNSVALPPLIVLGALLVFGTRALTRLDPAKVASAASRARTWDLDRWRIPLGLLTTLAVLALTALPVWSMVWHAGRVGGLASAGQAPGWSLLGLLGTLLRAWDDASEALKTSLSLAAIGASLSVPLAWSLAWIGREPGIGRWVAILSVSLALATPGPVAGMALVFAYSAFTPIYDSAAMIVLAVVLRTFSYAFLILWPAIRAIPPEQFEAAAVDGLSPLRTIQRVAIPMTRTAILAAWGVAFVLALGELPATYLVAPPGLTPLSIVIWGMLHTGVESRLAGIVLIMMGVVAVAGGFAAYALGRLDFDRT